MTTDLTTQDTNVPDLRQDMTPEERRAAIRARAAARRAAGGAPSKNTSGMQYIKLDANTGALTYGRNQMALPVPGKWVVDAESMLHGYHWWEGGRPQKTVASRGLDEAMPVLPAGAQMQDRQNDTPGWGEFRAWNMTFIGDGELKGMQCVLDLGTGTGTRAMDDLVSQVDAREEAGHDELNPVMEMTIDSIEVTIKQQNNRKRTVYLPVFKILGWNMAGTQDIIWLDNADDDEVFDPLG